MDTTTTTSTTDPVATPTAPAAPLPRKFYSIIRSDGVNTRVEGTELLVNTGGACIIWDGPNIVALFWEPRQVKLTKIEQPTT